MNTFNTLEYKHWGYISGFPKAAVKVIRITWSKITMKSAAPNILVRSQLKSLAENFICLFILFTVTHSNICTDPKLSTVVMRVY